MYEAPTLQRFGSFRELTLTDKTVPGMDSLPGIGDIQCNPNPKSPTGPGACIVRS